MAANSKINTINAHKCIHTQLDIVNLQGTVQGTFINDLISIQKHSSPQEVEILQSLSRIAHFKLSCIHQYESNEVETSQWHRIDWILGNYKNIKIYIATAHAGTRCTVSSSSSSSYILPSVSSTKQQH